MFNSKRTVVKVFKEGRVVETEVSKDLASVLYANGKSGKDISLWSTHHLDVKRGKVKDVIPVQVQITHIGNPATTEVKKIEIPFTAVIQINSIGKPKMEKVPLPGYEEVRIPNIINAETVIDKEVWDNLDEAQKAHLSHIDTWDAYDELIEYLSAKDRKPSFYAGALQQIYNRAKRPSKMERKYKEVETHSLENVDINITIISKGFEWKHHINAGSIENCKGQIVRSYAFNLPRAAMIKAYITESDEV